MKALRRTLRRWRDRLALYNLSMMWNGFFDRYTGGLRRPAFFDIDQVFPELRRLDQAYEDIRAELLALMPYQQQMPRYHEIDSDLIRASGRYQRDKSWNVFMLYSYSGRPKANRARCPKTCAVLDTIPNLSQAFFSILDGGKSIPAHEGPTRSYLRYHLALKVPAHNPPRLRVREQYYTWKEGESVLFDDSWEHEVYNEATEPRAVLIVDVLRPLPWFPDLANKFLRHILGAIFYGRRILRTANAHALPVGEPPPGRRP
ncbi:beta-hydroxylase [Corallococcus coralloides DSM 2259]|uniref:Beta-hydroxylase n=1 Tax=Corallococcus coralloides (strain ATCC 25202 / DSM 2259 / NBRC 100086 / M2) TaxID=1144275 RepID=H8N136_CORCM|nr:aspartyl/asparaginyl beta-hydroxylase domain-containing protein [Corallococcus coralloides]AFE07202.1 beta-hydroxylase [Corallococcus coralloides DSM 2259]